MPDASATERTESRPLTGLRGIGALLVISHHVFLHLNTHLQAPALEGLLRRGFMGVDLFFVLSGFIMSMVYGDWFRGPEAGRARRTLVFLIRRIARLWPLHVTVLLALLVFGDAGFGAAVTPRLLAANVAMMQAWGWSAEINPPAWSVSTELLAYLAFPALTGLLLRSRTGPVLGAVLVVLLIAACLHFAPPIGPARRGWLDIYFNYSPLPALRCLAGFMSGMIAWRAGQDPVIRRCVANAWLGPAALILFIALLVARTSGLEAYPLLLLAVMGMHYGHGPLVALFARGPLHRLGVLSYAVYLVHYALLMDFPMAWAPLWLVLPAYLAAVFLLASLAHAAIEAPGRAAMRRAGEAALALLLPAPVGPPLRPGPP